MEFAKVLAVNVTLVHKSLLLGLRSNLKKTVTQEKKKLSMIRALFLRTLLMV